MGQMLCRNDNQLAGLGIASKLVRGRDRASHGRRVARGQALVQGGGWQTYMDKTNKNKQTKKTNRELLLDDQNRISTQSLKGDGPFASRLKRF